MLAIGLAALGAMAGCGEDGSPQVIDMDRVPAITRLAVLPFEDGPGVHGRNSGRAVSGFVTAELAKHPRYRIVERSRLKSVMDEQDLQAADFADARTAAKVGRLLGADGVILGTVSQYDMDKTTVYVHIVPVVSKDYKVGASVRMIDVTNGQVVYAHSACGSSSRHFTEAGRQAARRLLAPLVR
jgi:curli biogenesis system outer membrane secretion channel CsgG